MVFRRLVQPIVSLSINAWHVISRSGSSQFILTVEKEGRARHTRHQKTIYFILQKIDGVKTMIRFDRVIIGKRLPLKKVTGYRRIAGDVVNIHTGFRFNRAGNRLVQLDVAAVLALAGVDVKHGSQL